MVRADTLATQSWTIDLQAGRASYETAPLPSRTANSILGFRYARDDRSLQVSLAAPLGSGDLYWGAVRAGDRLAFRRGRIETGFDTSLLAHAHRNSGTGVTGSGGQLRILPLLSSSLGPAVAELAAGPSFYRGRVGGAEWSRDLLPGELSLRLPVRPAGSIAGSLQHLRVREASYARFGVSASTALGRSYLWGSIGVWLSALPPGTPSSGWGAGASLSLRPSTDLWAAARHEPFDPLFLGTALTSWSIGVSHRLGGPAGGTPRAGPELRPSGTTILRLPLPDTPRPPSVAGDFSGWEPIRMHRRGGHWQVELQLDPGVYYYAFRDVAGTWFVPESVPNRREDGMGGLGRGARRPLGIGAVMTPPETARPAADAPLGASSNPADSEVVQEVLAGRTDRFAVLVLRHQDALFRQARAMGLDPDTSADVVHDALVRSFEGLARWRERSPFRVWLMQILRNRCLDHLKSVPSRRNRPLTPTLPVRDGCPEVDRERHALRDALEEALRTLPPDQREAFVLRHVEAFSFDDMSEVVGASVSALKMRVHRAREALRETLKQSGFTGDVTAGGEWSSLCGPCRPSRTRRSARGTTSQTPRRTRGGRELTRQAAPGPASQPSQIERLPNEAVHDHCPEHARRARGHDLLRHQPSGSEDAAFVRILLTDAPVDYLDEAWVWISRICLVPGEEDPEEGPPFVDLFNEPENPLEYDLLTLRDGVTADLTGEIEVPAGQYRQLRMIVARAKVTLHPDFEFNDGSGRTKNLFIPSGARTGIKVILDEPVTTEGGTISVILVDFDVNENFVIQGNPHTPAGIIGVLFTPALRELSCDVD